MTFHKVLDSKPSIRIFSRRDGSSLSPSEAVECGGLVRRILRIKPLTVTGPGIMYRIS